MRIWTIQNAKFWDNLKRDKEIIADPYEVNKSFVDDGDPWTQRDAYSWMVKQMRTRLPRTKGVFFPLWAYGQKPDLRFYRQPLKGKGKHVRIELEVPNDYLLVSDLAAWMCVLNYWYLGTNKDANAITQAVRQQIQKPTKEPIICQDIMALPVYDDKMRKSWEKIFDLPFCQTILKHKGTQYTQVTLWRIKQGWIKKVDEFQPA